MAEKRRKTPEYANGVPPREWRLRLYVTDWTPKCTAAYRNLKKICQDNINNKCQIEVVDLLEHPEMARADQVIAVPTLVKVAPQPRKLLVGDLSHAERVVKGLDIGTVEHGPA